MTFAEATRYLSDLIDYEKTPDFSYSQAFKLDRVVKLMAHIGDPFRAYKSIHIAGTKGKGSVAVFCEALLRAQGFRTGLFTSPHLVDFRERVRIRGEKIPEQLFAEIVTDIEPWATRWQSEHPEDRLSFFDVLTAAGFEAFRRNGIEIAVVEVGMGGRLDATNVLTPLVSVVTPIAREHTRFLGSTLKEIAREKAGIIKQGVPVISAPQSAESAEVLAEVASEKRANLTCVGQDITLDEVGEPWAVRLKSGTVDGLALAMQGRHQRQNFALALAALDEAGILPPQEVIRMVASETVAPGRLQKLPTQPPCMLDVAHTPESAACLAEAIKRNFPGRRVSLVFSCAADKNVAAIARVLAPVVSEVVLVGMPGPRAMPLGQLEDAWRNVHSSTRSAATVSVALESFQDGDGRGAIVVAGSFILVGAAMQHLGYSPP